MPTFFNETRSTCCEIIIKGIIRVSKLQGIDLLLDLRELTNSNDVHKSLVGALF